MKRRRKAGCAWSCGGVLAACALTAVGLGLYIRQASEIPELTPPSVALPVPNARDGYIAAVALLPRNVESESALSKLSTAELRAYLEAVRPTLKRFRASLTHRYLTPPSYSYTMAYPELPGFRNVARALVLEGLVAEREGRPADAARSYLDAYRLGTQVPRGGVMIHGLVGIAIEAVALAPLDRLAPRLDADTAAKAARELERLEATRVPVAEVLSTEAIYGQLATIEMMRAARGGMQFRELLQGATPATGMDWEDFTWGVRYTLTPKKQILERIRTQQEAWIAQAKLPFPRRGPSPPQLDDPISNLLMPVFGGAIFAWDRADANVRLVEARLAARVYTVRNGALPPNVEALTPHFLTRVPIDPFASKPLLSRRMGSGVLIYSRGPDKDDDGGVQTERSWSEASKGDYLMQRPPKRTVAPTGVRSMGAPPGGSPITPSPPPAERRGRQRN